jgi:hypothetical protein
MPVVNRGHARFDVIEDSAESMKIGVCVFRRFHRFHRSVTFHHRVVGSIPTRVIFSFKHPTGSSAQPAESEPRHRQVARRFSGDHP